MKFWSVWMLPVLLAVCAINAPVSEAQTITAIPVTPSQTDTLVIESLDTLSFYSIAITNTGNSGEVIIQPAVSAQTDSMLPIRIRFCETNPSTGECLNSPADEMSRFLDHAETASFAVFVRQTSLVAGGEGNPLLSIIFYSEGFETVGHATIALSLLNEPAIRPERGVPIEILGFIIFLCIVGIISVILFDYVGSNKP